MLSGLEGFRRTDKKLRTHSEDKLSSLICLYLVPRKPEKDAIHSEADCNAVIKSILFYAGTNNTLVLIPGAAATSAVWQGDFLRGLAQDREVITFDPRGYGSADTTPVDQLTMDSIASSLVDFFDALGLESPDVFGWSWGGFVTLWLGAFYGDSVGNLIVFSTTSAGEQLLPGPQYESIIAGSLDGQGTPPGDIFPDSEEGNAALCRFIAFARIMPGPIFSPDQIRSQTKLLISIFAQNTLTEALSNITNPLFVGHGSLDIVLSDANAEDLYSNVSTVSLQIGIGSGHAYLFQELDAVLAGVQEFLEDFDDSESFTGPASN